MCTIDVIFFHVLRPNTTDVVTNGTEWNDESFQQTGLDFLRYLVQVSQTIFSISS